MKTKKQKKEKKKKRFSSQKFYEIRCESTKITKLRAVNTSSGVLDLDLRSSSPEPVNFFGEQSSVGRGTIFVWGGTSSHLGGHGPEMLPQGAGLQSNQTLLRSKTSDRFDDDLGS